MHKAKHLLTQVILLGRLVASFKICKVARAILCELRVKELHRPISSGRVRAALEAVEVQLPGERGQIIMFEIERKDILIQRGGQR